jgi:putative transposase
MKDSIVEVYLHLVWATWDRASILHPPVERAAHRTITQQANELGCQVLAIGGWLDHVHVVVKLGARVTVADLVQHLKGVSSHCINEHLRPNVPFRWQGGYAAYSVSPNALQDVIGYVRGQKQHHRDGTIRQDMETTPGDVTDIPDRRYDSEGFNPPVEYKTV